MPDNQQQRTAKLTIEGLALRPDVFAPAAPPVTLAPTIALTAAFKDETDYNADVTVDLPATDVPATPGVLSAPATIGPIALRATATPTTQKLERLDLRVPGARITGKGTLTQPPAAPKADEVASPAAHSPANEGAEPATGEAATGAAATAEAGHDDAEDSKPPGDVNAAIDIMVSDLNRLLTTFVPDDPTLAKSDGSATFNITAQGPLDDPKVDITGSVPKAKLPDLALRRLGLKVSAWPLRPNKKVKLAVRSPLVQAAENRFANIKLNADVVASDTRAKGRLTAGTNGATVKTTFAMPTVWPPKPRTPLRATVALRVPETARFVPGEQVTGRLSSDIDLAGTAGAPQLTLRFDGDALALKPAATDVDAADDAGNDTTNGATQLPPSDVRLAVNVAKGVGTVDLAVIQKSSIELPPPTSGNRVQAEAGELLTLKLQTPVPNLVNPDIGPLWQRPIKTDARVGPVRWHYAGDPAQGIDPTSGTLQMLLTADGPWKPRIQGWPVQIKADDLVNVQLDAKVSPTPDAVVRIDSHTGGALELTAKSPDAVNLRALAEAPSGTDKAGTGKAGTGKAGIEKQARHSPRSTPGWKHWRLTWVCSRGLCRCCATWLAS